MITKAEKRFLGLYASLVCATALLIAGLICLSVQAWGHEHMVDETSEEGRVVQFLQTWFRPSGTFEGIEHRQKGCCFVAGPLQDCFQVDKVKLENGVRYVWPKTSDERYAKWFNAEKTGVAEDIQKDPRESPDGRSYVCIQGEEVVCLVWGSGQ